MASLEEGARQAVAKCMKITAQDKVAIIADRQSSKIAEALHDESKKISNDVAVFYLEDFGRRPLKKLPLKIENAVKESTAIFYTAASYEQERNSLRKPIIRLARKRGREAHMPDINEEIMLQGMCVDYDLIKQVSKKVYDIVKHAREISVVTEKGTNLKATFSPSMRWIISDGDICNAAMRWSNLPDGEVFTCVENIEGKAVVDGCLGDYFRKYGLLDKTPLTLEINDGRVARIECANKNLLHDIQNYIKQDKNADRIGEFALGTNIGLKKLIGNLLQDEKFPGVHIAIGSGYPKDTGAKWDSKAHCDCVMRETTVFVDGRKIMEKGKYLAIE